MGLETREIQREVSGKLITDQFMVDEDYNVPDSRSDVQRIVASRGQLKVDDVKLVENYIRVTGKIEFHILYVTESLDPSLCSLDGAIPFEEMIYTEDGMSTYEIKSTRVELDTTMIHSRKLRIKAMGELELQWEKQLCEEIPTDISSEISLYKKMKPMELLRLHTSKKDMYRIKEEITLSGTKETIGNLLWTDIVNRKLDTKLETDELQITGELLAFCFYESPEGKIDWLEQALPYYGNVECYGADATMYHRVDAVLDDVIAEARLDEDGEMRVVGIDGTLKLRVAVYEEEKMEVLEDVYSLEKHCKLEREEICYDQLVMQNHSKYKMTERLTLPELNNDVLQVCHSSGKVQIDRISMVQEGVQVEGVLHICFLYVKANDEVPFDTWQGMLPFSYIIECNDASDDMNYHISGMLEQLNVGLVGDNDVEMKAVLAFHCFFYRNVKMDTIKDIKMEEVNIKELEKIPGVVGYIVKEGDDLWSLAKKYSTTTESIMKLNDLGDGVVKTGERILIFKGNMGIL